MNTGETLFAQVMEFVPWTSFGRIVDRYAGNAGARRLLLGTEQFRVMAFAQLTWRESLRDIEVILAVNAHKLYAIGLRNEIRRATLADANEGRDWRIWADLAAVLIRRARKLYLDTDVGLELTHTSMFSRNQTFMRQPDPSIVEVTLENNQLNLFNI